MRILSIFFLVSIPYSTIKIHAHPVLRGEGEVSIPYSTIKIVEETGHKLPEYSFNSLQYD